MREYARVRTSLHHFVYDICKWCGMSNIRLAAATQRHTRSQNFPPNTLDDTNVYFHVDNYGKVVE